MAQRPIQPMPEDVLALLEQRGLLERYNERPHYQRNDYLGWIARAVRPETRQKRISQMLDELGQNCLESITCMGEQIHMHTKKKPTVETQLFWRCTLPQESCPNFKQKDLL